MKEDRSFFKIVTVKPRGYIPLEMPKFKWMQNIRMDLKVKGVGGHL
jgi:hypothetical protein